MISYSMDFAIHSMQTVQTDQHLNWLVQVNVKVWHFDLMHNRTSITDRSAMMLRDLRLLSMNRVHSMTLMMKAMMSLLDFILVLGSKEKRYVQYDYHTCTEPRPSYNLCAGVTTSICAVSRTPSNKKNRRDSRTNEICPDPRDRYLITVWTNNAKQKLLTRDTQRFLRFLAILWT